MKETPAPYFEEGAILYHDCSIREAMPILIEAGLQPITPSLIMDARNKAVGTKDEDILWNNSYCTGVGLIVHAGLIHFIPYPNQLRELNSEVEKTEENSMHDFDFISGLSGSSTIQKDKIIFDSRLSEKEAKQHQGWLKLADGNQKRLDRYIKNTFKLGKDQFDHVIDIDYSEAMEFSINEPFSRSLRMIAFNRLFLGSGIICESLHYSNVRLVGIPNSSVSNAKGLENLLSTK